MIVPATSMWTAEDRYEVRPCRWAGGALAVWQLHAPGEGRPLLAKPHVVRQRKAMARLLCDVCGEPTPAEDRWSLSSPPPTDVGGQICLLQVEPCVHLACGQIAARACPMLRSRRADGVLMLRQVLQADLVAAFLTPAAVEEFTGQPWAGGEVVGHLKLRVTDWRRAPIEQLDAAA